MKPFVYSIVLILLAVAATPAPPASGQPAAIGASAALDPARLGMVIRDPWYDFGTDPNRPDQPNRAAQDRMGQILEQTGVRWVRLEFFVEGSDAAAIERNISRYDYFVQTVAPRHSLKILGLLSFGLVRDIDPLDPARGLMVKGGDDPLYGGGINDYMRSWLDRARAIVARYPGQISAYQILNEQNRVAGHGGAGISASVAARLHTKFYLFFKHNDREPLGQPSWRDAVAIVVGGLHPRGTTTGATTITDRDYLRGYYQSDGFISYANRFDGAFPLDGLGYHPYPAEIRLSLAQIDAEVALIQARLDVIRAVLVEVGDPDLPLWISEVGYNAGYLRQTELGQATFLKAVFSAVGARPDVAAIFWFKYEDFPGSPSEPQLWGIVHIPFTVSASCPGGACYAPDGEPAYRRASYLVYRELAGITNQRLALPLIGN